MRTIVHVTADYPDAVSKSKTPAVRNLLALVPEYRHVVYSINRTSGVGGTASIVRCDGDVSTITYRAPPYGITLERGLRQVSRVIVEDLAARHVKPSLVHAHKFTVEGLVARAVSGATSTPFICSFWGNTDHKIIAAKPLSRRLFRQVASDSRKLLPATPWAAAFALRSLAVPASKLAILPIVCQLQPPLRSALAPNRIVTIFNLDFYRGKNVSRLIDAVRLLRDRGRPVELDIFGGGNPRSAEQIAAHIRKCEGQDFVALRGPVAHDQVQETINKYAAFAMPSLRETYGMVFIESLFAGVPIVYPKGQAVDGFFDDVDIGGKCDARSAPDVAGVLAEVLAKEDTLKANIATLFDQGFFARFEASQIAGAYRHVIEACATTAAGS